MLKMGWYASDRKREMRLWWMRGFHEVRWRNLWLLWLFANSPFSSLLLWLCWWHIGCGNKWKSKSREVERWGPDVVPEPKERIYWFQKLPKFYLSFWTTCPYKERFRRCFVTERKRQWEARHWMLYITSWLMWPESRAKTLPPSKYGRKRARVERENYDSWYKIIFWYNTPENKLGWSRLVALLLHAIFRFLNTSCVS